jgi:phosphinothricin acetyltransferase
MKIIAGQREKHSDGILAIFNEAILHTTVLYDYKPRTPAMMDAWFEMKAKGNYPVLVAENESGEVMGFASYGAFRPFPAYKYTVEHSVYIDTRFRRQGLGRLLLREIIAAATAREYRVMVGVIDSGNEASIALHQEFGFEDCGRIREVGFKFGQWLDIVFYQLLLPGPAQPVEE